MTVRRAAVCPVSSVPLFALVALAVSCMAPTSAQYGPHGQPAHQELKQGYNPAAEQHEDLAYCESGMDCDVGFCKDRGDGVRVCMGDGIHGDYCTSTVDCGGGNFCKARGDGFKVCMGDGRSGEVCNSTIDCEDGFCKDRGDGIKLCM